MTRTVKSQDERQNEILDTAQALFFERGYEATPVSLIISRIGISKGAFYHHFRSKEELLDRLVARMTAAILESPQDSTKAGDDDAIGQLNGFYARAAAVKTANATTTRVLMRVLYRPENLHLRHRLEKASIAAARPVLARIIARGMVEGTFDCQDATWTAELILKVGTLIQDTLAEYLSSEQTTPKIAVTLVENRLALLQGAIERLLGAPRGSIRIVEDGAVAAILGSSTTS